MPLSTYYLKYGRHLARLRRRCRGRGRGPAYAPTSSTASHALHTATAPAVRAAVKN